MAEFLGYTDLSKVNGEFAILTDAYLNPKAEVEDVLSDISPKVDLYLLSEGIPKNFTEVYVL